MVMVMNKNELVSLLEKQTVRVKFTKTDGSVRLMNCTLNKDVVVPYVKTSDSSKIVNNNVIPVWDVDKNAWRSFRIDSVTEIYK